MSRTPEVIRPLSPEIQEVFRSTSIRIAQEHKGLLERTFDKHQKARLILRREYAQIGGTTKPSFEVWAFLKLTELGAILEEAAAECTKKHKLQEGETITSITHENRTTPLIDETTARSNWKLTESVIIAKEGSRPRHSTRNFEINLNFAGLELALIRLEARAKTEASTDTSGTGER